jgi:hypothetical protein
MVQLFFGLDNIKMKKLYFSIISKLIRKNIYKLYYKYLLFINKSKFDNIYLNKLLPILKIIYKRNPIINIINLKHYFVNSELLSRLMVMKIRNRKINLKRLILKLKRSLDSRIYSYKRYRKILSKPKYLFMNLSKNNILLYRPDRIIKVDRNYFSKLIQEVRSNRPNIMLNYIYHKNVSGIMMRINGRLTKRFTASRSINKVFNKGFVKNMYSQYNGFSTPMLKGFRMSNVQYTNINYKTRVGAFGIKG